MECLEGKEGPSAFRRILEKVRDGSLDVQAVVYLLRLYQESNPAVKTALLGRPPEDVEAAQPKGRAKLCPPGPLSVILGRCCNVCLTDILIQWLRYW